MKERQEDGNDRDRDGRLYILGSPGLRKRSEFMEISSAAPEHGYLTFSDYSETWPMYQGDPVLKDIQNGRTLAIGASEIRDFLNGCSGRSEKESSSGVPPFRRTQG